VQSTVGGARVRVDEEIYPVLSRVRRSAPGARAIEELMITATAERRSRDRGSPAQCSGSRGRKRHGEAGDPADGNLGGPAPENSARSQAKSDAVNT